MPSLRITVVGIVQGVGFRPFVYRAAIMSGVKGYVRNMGGSEVEIRVEGSREHVARFMQLFFEMLPPPARLEEVEVVEEPLEGFEKFSILPSAKILGKRSMIPPDIGICPNCLKEVLDPKSRWYKYPFNSCAWCGPRFSMMYRVPYDRENTAMNDFPLCPDCRGDYEDPWNTRRFHAQGISCPRCGPTLWLAYRNGEKLEVRDPLRETARLLDEGNIVAIKGLGGFHIAALATDDEVVSRLRERKRRPSKPFALMALDSRVVEKIALLPPAARRLLESPEKPIVLLPLREDSPVSPLVAPGLDTVGVMLPYTALHYMVLRDTRDKFLIMTSGNKRGKPMCIDEECAYRELAGFVDYFLLHNRRIVNRVDDSVVRLTAGEPTFLRRGRGYAPVWIRVPLRFSRPVVAFGAELQTAGAVAFEDKVVLTQYIGDADDYDVLEDLDRYLEFFVKTYNIDPSSAVLVVDKHPNYASRRLGEGWAEKHGATLVEVQHHHAHAVSVMADHKLLPGEGVVAITIDGMGYGDDGMIWGGEVLEVEDGRYRRIGHLRYQAQPGGDVATRYPVRMLVGILSTFMEESEILSLLRSKGLLDGLRWGEKEARIAFLQASEGRSPLTSSTGRILDAAAALLKVCLERTYEGEPAMKLEAYARGGSLVDGVEAPLRVEGGTFIVDTSRLFESLLEHIDADPRSLAYTVHCRLGEALGEIAYTSKHARRRGVVYLSGGAAVNDHIVAAIRDTLSARGVQVKLPRRVPPGDGGIALGQAVIAALVEDES